MLCEHSQLLGPYLDGELSEAQAATVREHLAACPACAAEAAAIGAVSRLMGNAVRSGMGEPSNDVMDRLRLHARDLVETNDYALLRIARVFTGLAASVLIAGLWLLHHHQAQPVIHPASMAMNEMATISPVDFEPKPDPGVEVTPPEPTNPDEVIQSLMGVPEASGRSLEGELP